MIIPLNTENNKMFTHKGMMQLIAKYEVWLKENNINYTLLGYNGWGEPHEIEMADNDAIVFKLRFGL